MTVFSNAAQWLQSKRTSHALVDVVYERSSTEYAMEAQLGRTVYDAMDNFGITIRQESRDYLITTDYFEQLPAGKQYPRLGDKIKETIDLQEHVYKVTSIFGADQCYQEDMHRMRFRIHTKRVSEE